MFPILRPLLFAILFLLAFATGVALSSMLRSQSSGEARVCGEPVVAEAETEPREVSDGPHDSAISETLPDVNSVDVSSPYDIQRFVEQNPTFDARALWQRLDGADSTRLHGESLANNRFFEKCDYCSTETDETNVGEFRDTVLLRIENRGTEECRYLLFQRADSADFHLIGFIDHDFGRYQMPKHRWVEIGERTYLVVRVQTTSGSGVSGFADRLFALHHGRLSEIAIYPGQGHEMTTCDDRALEFSGKINQITGSPTHEMVVRVTLEVHRLTCGKTGTLDRGRTKRRMVFRWSARTGESVFDASASNASRRELEVMKDIGLLDEM